MKDHLVVSVLGGKNMLYSVYCKWIIDETDEIEFSEIPLYNNWVVIGNNLGSSEVMDILLQCENNVYADRYIQVVLPELNFGDKVINIKNNQIGTVVYFDQEPIKRFDDVYTDEYGVPVNKIFEFVTVESEGDTLLWEMKDLIVINGADD